MTKILKSATQAGPVNQKEPRLASDILGSHLAAGDSPLAVAYRSRFPNTELCIDLKLITCKVGRLDMGCQLTGTLVRDGDMHYTFVEDASKEKVSALHGWSAE